MPTAPSWRCCGPCPRPEGNAGGQRLGGSPVIAALPSLWRGLLALISDPSCPLCAGAVAAEAVVTAPGPAPPAQLCGACLRRLALPEGGLQGDEPLLWCAAAPYDGALRQLLLRQRPRPEPPLIAALALEWHRCCRQVLPGALLVPIPSWKRRGNPLPLLLAQALARWAGPAPHPWSAPSRAHPAPAQPAGGVCGCCTLPIGERQPGSPPALARGRHPHHGGYGDRCSGGAGGQRPCGARAAGPGPHAGSPPAVI